MKAWINLRSEKETIAVEGLTTIKTFSSGTWKTMDAKDWPDFSLDENVVYTFAGTRDIVSVHGREILYVQLVTG